LSITVIYGQLRLWIGSNSGYLEKIVDSVIIGGETFRDKQMREWTIRIRVNN